MRLKRGIALVTVVGAVVGGAGRMATTQARPRNVIVFVADGLRHGSVTEGNTPSLWKIRTEGVDFENTYSLFPTFTLANASAIATGHGLGDTGVFSNDIWVGYPTFVSGNFGLGSGTPVPFLENDQVLADLHDHFGGSFLGEQTLLDLAAAHGYNTAAIGKVGPVAMQTPAAIAATPGGFPTASSTIVVDDATGTANAPALPPRLLALLGKEHIAPEAPGRTNGYGVTSAYSNGNAGTNTRTGTLAANVVQQQWFTDVTTRGILPLFGGEPDKPFAIVLWSRDPDGTQHNHGDSHGTLFPGINGPTSRDGVQNADRTLARLLAWLDAHPDIKANTDLVVTSDHGFATISRREIDRTGRPTASQSATHDYEDASGVVDTEKGTLPQGFLAIDLSLDLHLGLFDPDRRTEGSRSPYRRVRLTYDTWEHPSLGNGLIATDVFNADGSDATAIVAANGGSDLIYVPGVPSGNADRVKQIAGLLLKYDYVGSVFVDDQYGEVPGALPLSAIGLVGTSKTPRPALVVAFKTFYLNPDDLQTAVQIADTGLQEGQGMHGGFGRDNTYNNMAAYGPDFKQRFVDRAPAGNADIAPTLASVMGLELMSHGTLRGRVLMEALETSTNGPAAPAAMTQRILSMPANGRQTLLQYQQVGRTRYLDSACIVPSDEPAAACH